jgi:L-aspartate oxidase
MALQAPRYLVPFHPKQVPHFFTDVLIIGGGLAGLRAANAVDSKLWVLVVTKDNVDQSSIQHQSAYMHTRELVGRTPNRVQTR